MVGTKGIDGAVPVQEAILPSQPVDFPGKVVPGGFAFVGIVVDSRGELVRGKSDQVKDGGGQVIGPGGAPPLIGHHADAVSFLHKAEHGVDEVGAVLAVKPCGAEDDAFGAGFAEPPLSFRLGSAIDSGGVWRIRFLVGPGPAIFYNGGTGKDIVGGDVEQSGAEFLCHVP